mgnify:CR=1 FL=1
MPGPEGVEWIDPSRMLYSLCTICDRLPGGVQRRFWQRPLAIHEDDWRQFEFVSAAFRAVVEAELEAIQVVRRGVHRDASGNPVGFRECHVRHEIESPLAHSTVSMTEVQAAFRVKRKYRGLSIPPYLPLVRDGFAYETDSGLLVYGCASGGFVSELCLGPWSDSRPDAKVCDQIASLLQSRRLLLVHWPAGVVAADRAGVEQVFAG